MKQIITKNIVKIAVFTMILFVAYSPLLSARAAEYTWTGGGDDDNWSTEANWDTGTAPVNDGSAEVHFGGSTRLTPNLDVEWDVDQIIFNPGASAFIVGGTNLTVRSNGKTCSTAAIINNSSVLQTISANVNHGLAWNPPTYYWRSISANSGDIALTGDSLYVGNNPIFIYGTNNILISGKISAHSGNNAIHLEESYIGTVTLSVEQEISIKEFLSPMALL